MDAFGDKWPRWRQLTSRAAHRGVLCFGPVRDRRVTNTNPHRAARLRPGHGGHPTDRGSVTRRATGPAASAPESDDRANRSDIRQLTDVSHCNLQHHLSCNPAPERLGSRAADALPDHPGQRTSDDHDRAAPSDRTPRAPRPAARGTGRGGRSPPPGPRGPGPLARPGRPGRRGPAHQRPGHERHPAPAGRDDHARRAVRPRPAPRRRARQRHRPGPDPGPDPVRRVGLLPHPRGPGGVLHARVPAPTAGVRDHDHSRPVRHDLVRRLPAAVRALPAGRHAGTPRTAGTCRWSCSTAPPDRPASSC